MNETLIVLGVFGAWWLFYDWVGRGGYERAERAGMAVGMTALGVGALVGLFLIAGMIWS